MNAPFFHTEAIPQESKVDVRRIERDSQRKRQIHLNDEDRGFAKGISSAYRYLYVRVRKAIWIYRKVEKWK